MTILSRYVLVEVLKTCAAALLVFSLVFVVGSLYEFVREEFSPRQIGGLLPYVVVYTLPFLLPIAVLVGCSLAYGRLAADNEVLPVSAGGVPRRALLWPALATGLAASAVLYGLQGTLVPYGLLKKKDLVRGFIEQMVSLGAGENKRIAGPNFHLFARRYDAPRVEGVEIVYTPSDDDPAPLALPGAAGAGKRPTEIVAREGTIRQDEARDAVVISIEGVSLTQFLAREDGASAAPAVPVEAGGLPPRGAPHHGWIDRAEIEVPMQTKVRDRTEFRSSRWLRAHAARLREYVRYAGTPPARGPAAAPAFAELAAALAAPGGAPGGTALAFARAGAALPTPAVVGQARERIRRTDGALAQRLTIALAPLLFALVAAAIALALEHSNRLLPFFLAVAAVSVTFFFPWVTAERQVDFALGSPLLYWIGPAATLALGLGLVARLEAR